MESLTQVFYKKLREFVNWREFACGWGAAVANISITYPINKIIFRQMLHGVNVKRAASQLYGEGIFFLYRGILPPLCQKTLSMSVMFGMYGATFNYISHNYNLNVYASKAISGLISGSLEAFLTPFERIQTLLQHREYHGKFKNTIHAFKDLRHYGIKEYYRGIGPILLRNGPSNVCFFIIRDEVKSRVPQYESAFNRTLVNFFSGAIIGASISACFYPLNVVKVHMQEQLGGKTQRTWTVLKNIYIERGRKIRYIYKGWGLNSTRAFCSWGVICAAYEQLHKIFY